MTTPINHCTCITVPFSTVGRITLAPSRTCPLHGDRAQAAKLQQTFRPSGSLDQESGYPADVSIEDGHRIERMSGEQLRRAGLAK